MNTSKSFRSISTVTVLAISVSMLTLTGFAGVQFGQKPDLRVAAIDTPGGLCKGNENKIRATIQNSQNIGVRGPVQAILHVKFPNGGQGQYTSTIPSGVGPRGSQPVWFNNVSLPDTGNYNFSVTVDPTNNIAETVENNNNRSLTRAVQKACGQATAPQTYILTVKVYEHGTWQGGQGQWIPGATVTLRKEYDSSFAPLTATTNSSGIATFPGAVSGTLYRFTAQKSGCGTVQSSPATPGSSSVYQMGSYNATRYLELNCQ